VARRAIATEIDLYHELCRANPEALWLHDLAVERDMQVAFVAESHLPRDLIGRLLQAAQFKPELLLVSSHEGLTKGTGLFNRLVHLSEVEPSAIAHLGPNAPLDVSIPTNLGMRAFHYPSGPDRTACSLIVDEDTERSRFDSIALGLARSRLESIDPASAAPTDIGYYAGGPLAAGFATWVGDLILDHAPSRVLFSGPAGQLLQQVTAFVNDGLPAELLTVLPLPEVGHCPVVDIARLAGQLDIEDGDRILVVDLGWTGLTHEFVELALQDDDDRKVEVTGAYLALPDSPPPTPGQWVWGAELPGARSGAGPCPPQILQALLAGAPPAPSAAAGFGADADPEAALMHRQSLRYGALRSQVEAGIREFVSDLEPWMAFGRDRGTPAMFEPARRIMINPTYAEASVLGAYPIESGPDSTVTLLATLPPPDQIDLVPSLLEAEVTEAPWRAGYLVLAAASAQQGRSSKARRSRLLRRRSIRHEPGGVEAC
jgi:hypothetical protein